MRDGTLQRLDLLVAFTYWLYSTFHVYSVLLLSRALEMETYVLGIFKFVRVERILFVVTFEIPLAVGGLSQGKGHHLGSIS